LVGVFLVDYFDLTGVGMSNSNQWTRVVYLEEGSMAIISSMRNFKACALRYVEVATCNLKELKEEV
jgi:hypothetical protein